MRTTLAVYGKYLLNCIFPLSCLVCAEPLDPLGESCLCRRCAGAIEPNPKPYCGHCGRSMERAGGTCAGCRRTAYAFRLARAPCLYRGVMRECIHRLKYNKKVALFPVLSNILIEYLTKEKELTEGIQAVVSVPLFSSKHRERGFNQSEVLARSVSEALRIPFLPALVKTRLTRPQSDLEKAERLRNLNGAFRVKDSGSVRGKELLLVDDVFTTGSTTHECSRVLIETGVRAVRVATIARGI